MWSSPAASIAPVFPAETTASALLSGTGNLVIGRVLLDLWSNGSFPQMTALALLISLVDALCVLLLLAALDVTRQADLSPGWAGRLSLAAGALTGLAILTKQTAVVAALMLVLHAVITS